MKSAGKSAMAGKGKKGKSKRNVREIHIRRGAGGGYIAKHDEEPTPDDMEAMAGGAPAPPAPEYPIADQQGLHDHLDQHMPDQAPMPAQGGGGM